MLAGVGGIDLVLLVVAADESVMPQTREHFDICKLLRVPAGVIVLTKSDLADAETRELAAIEVRELVAGSFLEGAPLVTVSARTGEGLDELRAALRAAATSVRTRSADGPARLPVDRVFSVRGFGTVVTGTLVSGRIRADDRLTVMPSTADGRPIAVRGVQVHGSRKEEAVAGQRAAVNLANLEVADLTRGQELVTPGAFETHGCGRRDRRHAARRPPAAPRGTCAISTRAPLKSSDAWRSSAPRPQVRRRRSLLDRAASSGCDSNGRRC